MYLYLDDGHPYSPGLTPTAIMLPARSALSILPRVSRLSARPVIARAYHEKVISHYERPRNVSNPPFSASMSFLEFSLGLSDNLCTGWVAPQNRQ